MTTNTETSTRSNRTRTVLLYAAVFSAFMILISLLVAQGIQMNREGFKNIEIATFNDHSGGLDNYKINEDIRIVDVEGQSGGVPTIAFYGSGTLSMTLFVYPNGSGSLDGIDL